MGCLRIVPTLQSMGVRHPPLKDDHVGDVRAAPPVRGDGGQDVPEDLIPTNPVSY